MGICISATLTWLVGKTKFSFMLMGSDCTNGKEELRPLNRMQNLEWTNHLNEVNHVATNHREAVLRQENNACQPLRRFIDLSDPTAVGMNARPQSIDDMTTAQAENRILQ